MNRHPVSLENLADWEDGRLDPETRRRVNEHLRTGCPSCQADLRWLRQFKQAARVQGYVEPPAELARRAKALYRAPSARAVPGRFALGSLRRFTPARAVLAALLLVILGGVLFLIQAPTVLAHQALVAAAQGVVQARPVGAPEWHPVHVGDRLSEGDEVQVPDGQATLSLFAGCRLDLSAGAELKIVSLRSGLLGGTLRVTLLQDTGVAHYDVPPLARLSSFTLRTPTGLITCQAGRFSVNARADETTVTVFQGTVRAAGGLHSTMLSAGQAAVIPAQGPVQVQPTPESPANEGNPTSGGIPTSTPSGHPTSTGVPLPTQAVAAPAGTTPAHTGTPEAGPQATTMPATEMHATQGLPTPSETAAMGQSSTPQAAAPEHTAQPSGPSGSTGGWQRPGGPAD